MKVEVELTPEQLTKVEFLQAHQATPNEGAQLVKSMEAAFDQLLLLIESGAYRKNAAGETVPADPSVTGDGNVCRLANCREMARSKDAQDWSTILRWLALCLAVGMTDGHRVTAIEILRDMPDSLKVNLAHQLRPLRELLGTVKGMDDDLADELDTE